MLKWTDTHEIARELVEKYSNIDPLKIRFTDLRQWVIELENFSDDPNRCGEKILEAIQMAWISEL